MLRSRLSPCLLINDGALVKSIKFGNYKYIGDPLNAVRIFNELCVDEIIILDITIILDIITIPDITEIIQNKITM